jgi:hypothetical protein
VRAGGGKSKGGQFERDICRALSLWVTRGKRDDIYWRSAMSGGRATVGLRSGKKRKAQAGDISYVDKKGKPLLDVFVIDCKFRQPKHVRFDVLLTKAAYAGTVLEYWDKIRGEARKFNKRPMLIIKQNNAPTFVFVYLDDSIGGQRTKLFNRAIAYLPRRNVIIYELEDLLRYGRPPRTHAKAHLH